MKRIIIISTSLILMIISSGCSIKKVEENKINIVKSEEKISITEDNADVLKLDIENRNEKSPRIKVENISDFPISNISIKYKELDKKDNTVLESQVKIKTTINPNEVIYTDIVYGEYTEKLELLSYVYNNMEYVINVDLQNDLVNIENNNKKIVDSIDYEILNISEFIRDEKKENIQTIKIKNSSNKNIGNIIIKVAELNEERENIQIDNISVLDVLSPAQEINVEYSPKKEFEYLSVVGYTYDDINEKSNIDIDLKNHSAIINEYK